MTKRPCHQMIKRASLGPLRNRMGRRYDWNVAPMLPCEPIMLPRAHHQRPSARAFLRQPKLATKLAHTTASGDPPCAPRRDHRPKGVMDRVLRACGRCVAEQHVMPAFVPVAANLRAGSQRLTSMQKLLYRLGFLMDIADRTRLVRRRREPPPAESPFRLIRSRSASELWCVAAAALWDSGDTHHRLIGLLLFVQSKTQEAGRITEAAALTWPKIGCSYRD